MNAAFFCTHEEGTQLGFGGGCGDEFEYGAEGEDGAIEADGLIVAWQPAKEEVARCPALGSPCGEVGCIRVNV
jgi:hypothetical protein